MLCFFFFFQAEDGIRDLTVTGVQTCALPISGHMAGVWARSDDTRGVHKAPANEVIRGAIDLELLITKGEHDQLNPEGINCIRAFPGRGIRVWGARTLSSDPAWRYLNVRRLFNFIEESILEGTHWVVFEPNDMALRSEEHTSELQSQSNLVCRLLLEKKKTNLLVINTPNTSSRC